MAEINFNQLLGQMNPIVRQNYEGVMGGQSFSDQYDPDKRTVNADGTITDTNSQNLTMKDGYSQMVDAYNQEQNIPETGLLSSIGSALNPFSELSASEMPQTYGLQNSMMGMSINPDGSLNYNNAQPQNLGFRSMVDMNNDAQNFDSQFSYPNRGPVATNIATAPQPKGMSYEQMVDLGLAGPDQDVGMTAGDLQNRQGILQGLQDKMGGLKDFLPFGDKSLSGMAVKGIKGIGSGLRSLVSKLGDGANYQQYDPNVDYSDFNPNMEINDFYDPRTKTNRFQRAKPGSFASFRTGADYFKARREKKAAAKIIADQKTAAKEQQAIESIRQQYASQGRDYGQGAASQATQDSYQDSQGSYAGASTQDYGGGEKDGGMIGYRDGGLASMFTRRR